MLIDAHLDLSWNALSCDRDLTETIDVINAREEGMTDCRARGCGVVSLPEMRRGGIAVCLGTVLARSRPDLIPREGPQRVSLDYGSPETAYGMAHGQLSIYRLLQSQGHLKMLGTANELKSHWDTWSNGSPETDENYQGSIADLQLMEEVLDRRGYSAEAINANFHENWMRFFTEHLPSSL